jgi:hypothetical protein
MKNKTLAVWLTLLLGSLGLQRLYLAGRYDRWAFLSLLPSVIGWYGVVRARTMGLDDLWSWVLIPFGGFALAATALLAIRYGLMDAASWNARFNQQADPEDAVLHQLVTGRRRHRRGAQIDRLRVCVDDRHVTCRGGWAITLRQPSRVSGSNNHRGHRPLDAIEGCSRAGAA